MNAYEQRAQQLALIQSIRESLPAGYTAQRWDETQVCVQYTPAANPDGRQRWYVANDREWAVLKAQLGLL